MRGFRIETEARNFCRMSPDVAGGLPASNCICEGGASALAASIPATAVTQHLEAHGFEARLSMMRAAISATPFLSLSA
jgi:pyroglutamyl-peptidase